MFENRKDAGKRLAKALEKYKDEDGLVLAIPKGGVEVGYEIAKCLNWAFSMLISRKLPFPDDPEAGFGAVAEDGSTIILDYAARHLSPEIIEKIIQQQKQEIKRRITILRKGKPLPRMVGQTVILVDDGIAMGSTMRAAILLCENRRAKKIIVASPVAGPHIAADLANIVRDVIILEKPAFFHAVAQAYANWYDVPDDEVIHILDGWTKKDSAKEM